MELKKIIRLTDDGNCAIVGLRGRGKDMLSGNIVVRKKRKYISNVDYTNGRGFIKFDPLMFDVKNTFDKFINGNIRKYIFPYDDFIDVWISDASVYFPSTFDKELNRMYPTFPVYMSLSRQLGESNTIINAQSIGRVWLKIREQIDIYINCDKCIYLPRVFSLPFRKFPKVCRFIREHTPKLVIQRVTVYDKEDSCASRRNPFLIKPPLFASNEVRSKIRMERLNYQANYGNIDRFFLIYFNRSNYNTRLFKDILANGS